MQKFVMAPVVILFLLVAIVSPYVTAKNAAIIFSTNTEETMPLTTALEEEIVELESETLLVKSTKLNVNFPLHINLCPQITTLDFFKPPHA